MSKLIPWVMVSPGKEVILTSINGGRGLRMRLSDMGLQEGMKLKVIHSQGRGPCVVSVKGSKLILGYGMAQKILVEERCPRR